jgi:uncharacterized protein
MNSLINQHRDQLASLCAKYHVRRLEIFGSASTGRFDPLQSDLDFLVEFAELPVGTKADTYFGLRQALAELFGREVDLVMERAITNPYFLESINRQRMVVYAA